MCSGQTDRWTENDREAILMYQPAYDGNTKLNCQCHKNKIAGRKEFLQLANMQERK